MVFDILNNIFLIFLLSRTTAISAISPFTGHYCFETYCKGWFDLWPDAFNNITGISIVRPKLFFVATLTKSHIITKCNFIGGLTLKNSKSYLHGSPHPPWFRHISPGVGDKTGIVLIPGGIPDPPPAVFGFILTCFTWLLWFSTFMIIRSPDHWPVKPSWSSFRPGNWSLRSISDQILRPWVSLDFLKIKSMSKTVLFLIPKFGFGGVHPCLTGAFGLANCAFLAYFDNWTFP